jgi:DNA repair protein RadA/Sms
MPDQKILYVCGEESLGQVKVRADRMDYKGENLLAIAETNADVIIATLEGEKEISLVVVDSIQTITSGEYMGFAGSVGQVRGGTQKLANVAKRAGIPLILVGHVTKEGAVAGPKVLEHIVDTVLYLEGDSQHLFRVLKTTKNRFGPVSEVGIFEMTEKEMRDVENPSEMFLSEKKESSGSCVSVVMEGFRPILFEVQALTTRTPFGYPRRTTSGFPVNRLQVLIAILQKRCGLNLSDQDVYVNIAGGFKVNEYAVDLAVCLAIVSSIKDTPLKGKTVAFGEVGLSGEVRNVSHQDKRIKEARKLGYTNVVSPPKTKSVREALREALQ